MMMLCSVVGMCDIVVEDFFIDYGKQDCCFGEFVQVIYVLLCGDVCIVVYKVLKCYYVDIIVFVVVFYIEIDGVMIIDVCVVFGGMVVMLKCVVNVEVVLCGQFFSVEIFEVVVYVVVNDFMLLLDWCVSVEYCQMFVVNFFCCFWLE